MTGYRLPAFTLMEMVVAMLLTAIVIGLTYTIFIIVAQSNRNFDRKSEALAEVRQLDALLQRDFGRAARIDCMDSTLVIQLQTAVVTYRFFSGFALRKSVATDTFRYRLLEQNAAFRGRPVGENGITDDFFLRIAIDEQQIPFHYHKTYSSEELIDSDARH